MPSDAEPRIIAALRARGGRGTQREIAAAIGGAQNTLAWARELNEAIAAGLVVREGPPKGPGARIALPDAPPVDRPGPRGVQVVVRLSEPEAAHLEEVRVEIGATSGAEAFRRMLAERRRP